MRTTASTGACHRHRIVTAPKVTPTADLRNRTSGDTMPARRAGPGERSRSRASAIDRERSGPHQREHKMADRERRRRPGWPRPTRPDRRAGALAAGAGLLTEHDVEPWRPCGRNDAEYLLLLAKRGQVSRRAQISQSGAVPPRGIHPAAEGLPGPAARPRRAARCADGADRGSRPGERAPRHASRGRTPSAAGCGPCHETTGGCRARTRAQLRPLVSGARAAGPAVAGHCSRRAELRCHSCPGQHSGRALA
jgi:hypothetical protein